MAGLIDKECQNQMLKKLKRYQFWLKMIKIISFIIKTSKDWKTEKVNFQPKNLASFTVMKYLCRKT